MITSRKCLVTRATILSISDTPPTVTKALSRLMRELFPPARIIMDASNSDPSFRAPVLLHRGFRHRLFLHQILIVINGLWFHETGTQHTGFIQEDQGAR